MMPQITNLSREHSSLIDYCQKALDLLSVYISGLLIYHFLVPSTDAGTPYQLGLVCGLLIAFILFRAFTVYKSWRGISFITELSNLILAWSAAIIILTQVIYFTDLTELYTREWLLCWWLLGSLLMGVMRYCIRLGLRELRARGYNQRSVVIIGYGNLGEMVKQQLEDSVNSGFNIAACFISKNNQEDDTVLKQGLAYLDDHRVDQIWLALPASNNKATVRILNRLSDSTSDIRIVPDMFSMKMMNQSLGVVAGLPVINLSLTPIDGLNRWLKEIQDRILSILILLLVSPLLVAIAVGVKLSSPGPIFFRQERLSWNGKPFMMYKFRSMPVDVESASGPVWAKPGEQRATRFGRFLRRTSLDELPQFINVLVGDMSIVGPRPERPEFVRQFKSEIPGYMQKHMVKAGITGWAQVNGWRGDTCLNTRIAHDLEYIRQWSLLFDLKIIFLTIFKGFFNRNAY